jgi:hypothetical protein
MFLRCFAYGLTEGESVSVTIDGQEVAFSHAAPQVDVTITDKPEAPVTDTGAPEAPAD